MASRIGSFIPPHTPPQRSSESSTLLKGLFFTALGSGFAYMIFPKGLKGRAAAITALGGGAISLLLSFPSRSSTVAHTLFTILMRTDDSTPPQYGASKPQPRGSSKPQPRGSSKPQPRGSSLPSYTRIRQPQRGRSEESEEDVSRLQEVPQEPRGDLSSTKTRQPQRSESEEEEEEKVVQDAQGASSSRKRQEQRRYSVRQVTEH